MTTPPVFFRTVPVYNHCLSLINTSAPFCCKEIPVFKFGCLSYSLAILPSGVYPKNNSVLVKRKHVQGYYTTSYIGEKKKEEHWCQMDSSSEIFSMEYDGKPCSREKE